jgi:hypothetical protein
VLWISVRYKNPFVIQELEMTKALAEALRKCADDCEDERVNGIVFLKVGGEKELSLSTAKSTLSDRDQALSLVICAQQEVDLRRALADSRANLPENLVEQVIELA